MDQQQNDVDTEQTVRYILEAIKQDKELFDGYIHEGADQFRESAEEVNCGREI